MKRTVLRVEELEQRDVPSAIEVAPVLLAPLSSGGVTSPVVATAGTLNAATVGTLNAATAGSPACPLGWGVNALSSPANPLNALGSPANSFNALGSPASPLSALGSPANPFSALGSPANPFSALGSPASEVARSLNALGAPFGQLAAPVAPFAPVNGVATPVVGALSNPLAPAPTCVGEAVQTLGIGATDLNVSNLDRLFIAAPGNPAHGVMVPAALTTPALGTLASGVL
jgi:hypothetical protein